MRKNIYKLINIISVKNPLLLKALRFGVAAGIEHKNALRTIKCSTIVDIGANRGQFALVARHCFPKSKIISFEPLSLPAKQFALVLGDEPGILLHQVAVGSQRNKSIIHISGKDDSSSLLPISSLQDRLFPGTAEIETEMVNIAPLSDYITGREIIPPALLKIDVQGFELEVLQGSEILLEKFQYIYVECSFVELYSGQAFADEVIAWLRERGFRFQGLYNEVYDKKGRAIQGDFLFQKDPFKILS